MTEQEPTGICFDCSEKLENFYLYKKQLIHKQEQLQTILNGNLRTVEIEDEEANVIEEEYLEECNYLITQNEKETEIIEVLTMPSVKNLNLQSPIDNETIVKLIDDIEEKNQIILQYLNPPAKTKRQKTPRIEPKKKCPPMARVARNEELKFEKQIPKVIMTPIMENGSESFVYSTEKSCSVCQQEFSSDVKLKRHQILSHPLENPITCCEQVFEFYSNYQKHQQSTHSKTVMCSLCGKILKNKRTFLSHKRSHQSVAERRFKCSYIGCLKTFNYKLHLDNHERIHSGERPFKCDRCPLSFRQSIQLIIHKRRHDGVNIKCSKCKVRFNLKRTQSQDGQPVEASEIDSKFCESCKIEI